MGKAETYEDWKHIAMIMDRKSGIQKWKKTRFSSDFDYKTAEYLTKFLRSLRKKGLLSVLEHTLSTTLKKDICGTKTPRYTRRVTVELNSSSKS